MMAGHNAHIMGYLAYLADAGATWMSDYESGGREFESSPVRQ